MQAAHMTKGSSLESHRNLSSGEDIRPCKRVFFFRGMQAKGWWTAGVRMWKLFCWSSMKSLKLADRSLHSSVPLYAALGHQTLAGISRAWCRKLPWKGFMCSHAMPWWSERPVINNYNLLNNNLQSSVSLYHILYTSHYVVAEHTQCSR